MKTRGVGARLGRTLVLQIAFISLAAILGVLLAKFMLEDVLIRQALRDEAAHFWARHDYNPDFPTPDTRNLTGYLGSAPENLSHLEPGFHNLQKTAKGLVLVSEQQGKRLVLVFDGARVDELAFWFGLVPLVLVLLGLYLSAWLGFRASRRAVSPIISLAREVRELDLESPGTKAFSQDWLPEQPDDEVRVLADAMERFTRRLDEFIARERQFTRDASHELRSPLTVLGMASELVANDPGLTASGRKALDRIKRATRDMEELIGAFLLLARENESGLPAEQQCINEIARRELETAKLLADDKPIEAHFEEQCTLMINAPEKVLSVLIGNLLRNAFSYTDAGEVSVRIEPGKVIIEDSGIGIAEDKLKQLYEPFVRGDSNRRGGYGVGLTIVRRLSDRFDWPVEITSEVGVGTRVQISFPDSQEA